ncbi:MAG TPA: cytochrome P450 [Deltaproteobacteria bacterium]|nr:cytochrome P450 [Deltaproteobacteria bacterium]
MNIQDLPLDRLDVITASIYGSTGYPHEAWARMRREDPVHWCEPPGYKPFWAITKHADITQISKHPELFRSEGRFILFPEDTTSDGEIDLEENPPLRMLVNMDPPEHREYRKLVSPWFTPRMVKRLEVRLEEITADIFDDLEGERELDFVTEIAALQPLRMITEILGIPREQEDFVLRVTNENFGLEDPEFQREGETQQDRLGFLTEAAAFLNALFEDRRRTPRDDLSSVLANATLSDGGPVPPFELFSLAFLVMVAGHDTTRNAISGGLKTFFEHPAELEKLRADPGLVGLAADEIVRWTTPVNHFSRTATRDIEFGGKSIREGDSLALFYASANRDEDVFEDPFTFRIDRDPNPHLGFGVGEHFCLGASLARMDLRVFWRQFVERVESIEPTGPIELLDSSFVGGPKHIPVRVKVRGR